MRVRWDFRYYELLFSPTRRSVSYSTPKSSRSDTPMRDHCGTVARRISFTNLVQVTENKLRSAIGSKLIGLKKAEPYSMTSCHMVEQRVLSFGYSLTQICNSLLTGLTFFAIHHGFDRTGFFLVCAKLFFHLVCAFDLAGESPHLFLYAGGGLLNIRGA